MKNKYVIISLIGLFALWSCNEMFQPDISNENVILLAPYDSVKTIYPDQQFKWAEINGAEYYNLRIVSPDFDKIELFLLDTNITFDNYTFSLSPGKYQWSVTANNYHSQTLAAVNTLIVDTNIAFANTRVMLKEPKEIYFNTPKIMFSWDNVNGAEKYRLEIRKDDWGIGSLFYANDFQTNSAKIELEEANYYWGIQAYDNETNTNTSFSYKQVMIDLTAPDIPSLISPVDNDTITESSATLKWSRGDRDGSPIYDSIFVASDSDFNNMKIMTSTVDTSYTIQPGNGEFFWKIRSYDAAGNMSSYSVYRKVIIDTK